MGIRLRRAAPDDAPRLAAVEVADDLIGFVRVGVVPEEVGEVSLAYLLDVLPEFWVLREYHRARGFYERLGWRPDGRAAAQDYGGVTLEASRYHRVVEE